MDTFSSPLAASGAPARRPALASLALAIGLALSACGGGDDPSPQREAYQPSPQSESASGSASEPSESSPASDESSDSESSPSAEEPEEDETTEPAEEPSSEEPSAAPADQECVGSDYLFTDLAGGIGCYDAKVTVEKVLNSGSETGGGVADSNVKCTPAGAGWNCAQLGDTSFGITVQAKDPSDDPLQDILDGAPEDTSSSDTASVDCSGHSYDFTDVQGMTCSEALAVLDPFADRDVPSGRSGGVQCEMETVSINAASHEEWTCARDSGGSFTAISR